MQSQLTTQQHAEIGQVTQETDLNNLSPTPTFCSPHSYE